MVERKLALPRLTLAWVKAAALSELAPEGAVLGVEAAGRRVALARVDGEVYAFADNCSHRDFPLSLGEVDTEACTVTCEWHGAAFDIRTGSPLCAPATRPIAVFADEGGGRRGVGGHYLNQLLVHGGTRSRPVQPGELRKAYLAQVPKYERLAINLEQALKTLLDENGLSYLSVECRIKTLTSFLEKIPRKGYLADPLVQCEDICGLRIICYYPSDIQRITHILRREFDVHESIDKGIQLGVQEFGYRSTHLVVSVRKTWLVVPSYHELNGLRAEIQVRTVLMHAWAEVEHKLAYKSKEGVPDPIRRRLSLLSASFEGADEQLEHLREAIVEYRRDVHESTHREGGIDIELELDHETLRAFLNFYFLSRASASDDDVNEILSEVTAVGFTMRDLVDAYTRASSAMEEYESDEFEPGFLTQAGALRAILDIVSEEYERARTRGGCADRFCWLCSTIS